VIVPVYAEREGRGGPITWTFLRHEKNGGKGKAVQKALGHATGEISVIHDADRHPNREADRMTRSGPG
jgi:cellulose synthase/poly-beta-1,6-N-acetylglucosamine synthase-like glycosyltransferase